MKPTFLTVNVPVVYSLLRAGIKPAHGSGDPAASEIPAEENVIVIPKGMEGFCMIMDVVSKKTSTIYDSTESFENLNGLIEGAVWERVVHMGHACGA